MSKWPNGVFTFELGHFGIRVSVCSRSSRKCENYPIQKKKNQLGHFGTVILGHLATP